MIRIAIAQINATVGDISANAAKIKSSIQKAYASKADIVVFPELALTGYPPEDLLYKPQFIKDNIKALKDIAKDVDDLTAVVGFVDQDKDGNLYNAAGILSAGEIKDIYHKQCLPNYGVFDEKRYFTVGKTKNIYSIGYDYFSVNICEDIWEGAHICQQQSQKGAGLIINISSSPFDIDKYKRREAIVKRRAKETNSYVVYTNLVGGQDELVFDGGSFVCSAQGEILARAEFFKEDFLLVDLKLSLTREMKYKSFDIIKVKANKSKTDRGYIKLRKTKNLNVNEKIYGALVMGTRDYITKNGFKKVLIGLSGGIDSALVAAVAVDAVGAENVVGVTMPSRYSSKATLEDAYKLAKNLKMEIKELNIEKAFAAYLDTLKNEFKGLEPNVAEENIQARIRGNLLMALSNKYGWLVLTTGNKSEFAVGYCTLYGDMSGGFAVIKDVPKTKVYELALYRNGLGQTVIPPSIIKRAPSAELRPNQKDQDSLGSYDDLDTILKDYVEDHKSLKQMLKGRDEEFLRKIIRLIDLSEYKRRQSPPGVKITARAFGKDWRLPITNRYKGFK